MKKTLKHNGRALQDLNWTTKRKNITGEEQYMQRPRSKNSHGVFCGQRATTAVTALTLYLSIFYFLRQKF